MGRTLGTPNNIFQEQEKKSDNDALNQILEEVQSTNQKVGVFYWLVIIGLILNNISLIVPDISWVL
jgi:hypothetical protein